MSLIALSKLTTFISAIHRSVITASRPHFILCFIERIKAAAALDLLPAQAPEPALPAWVRVGAAAHDPSLGHGRGRAGPLRPRAQGAAGGGRRRRAEEQPAGERRGAAGLLAVGQHARERRDLFRQRAHAHVSSPREKSILAARLSSVATISSASPSVALLFGQCDMHCFFSWHGSLAIAPNTNQ